VTGVQTCALPILLGSPFQPLELRGAQPVEQDWADLDSWAGLPGGLRWAYGVPLRLGLPRPHAASKRTFLSPSVTGPAVLFVAYSDGAGRPPGVAILDRPTAPVDTKHEALAWQPWPPIFTCRLLIAPIIIPQEQTARAINPGSRLVFAVTALRGAPDAYAPYLAQLADGAAQWRSMREAERKMAALTALGRARQLDRLAVLPYGAPGGRLASLLGKSRILEHLGNLSPEQLIQPDGLTPARSPVLLDLDGEEYLKTVRSDGDAAAAVLRYVKDGGLLVLATDGPWPMFYGKGPQGAPPDPLLPKMGLPLKGFEKPPAGERIMLVANPGQQVLADIPARVAFPTDDERLRAVQRDQLPPGATYVPIYAARGSGGADYGDAACLVEFPGGGRVLYVWFGLLRDPDAGPAIAEAVLRQVLAALPAAGTSPPHS